MALTHKNPVAIPATPVLPAAGGTWTDPTFGSKIMRLTDAVDGAHCYHGYSYWRCMSKDNRYIVLNSTTKGSQIITIDPATFTRTSIANLPAVPGWVAPPTQEIIWSTQRRNIMWCKNAVAGKIYEFDVDTGTYTQVKQFATDYIGQWFISDNDDVFVFLTHIQTDPYTVTGFKVWRRSTDTVIYSETFGPGLFDEAQIDKSGRWLTVKNAYTHPDGYHVRVIDLETAGFPTIAITNNVPGHSDAGNGFMVASHSYGPGSDGYVRRTDFTNPAVSTQLTTTAWWDNLASHLSICHANDNWVLVSNNVNAGDYSHAFANELYYLATDGTKRVKRLCHTYYVQDPYWGISRAASSYDGRYVVFASRWGDATAGSRIDAFLVDTWATTTGVVSNSASGEWDDPATWPSGLIPVAPNQITIADSTTLTIPVGMTAYAGLNAGTDTDANYALQTNGAAGTGILVNRGKLVFSGPIRQGNATWVMEAGSVVSHGGTAGVAYTWPVSRASSQPNALLRITGTQAKPVTFQKEAGADNPGVFGGSAVIDAGRVQATYLNVSDWGTNATTPVTALCYAGWGGSAAFDTYFRHCTFTRCGVVQLSYVNHGAIKFELSYVKIDQPLTVRALSLGGGNWTSTGIIAGGVRLIDHCVIHGQTVVSSGANPNDFTWSNGVLQNNGTNTLFSIINGSRCAAWSNMLIYSNAPGALSFGGTIGGTLQSTLALRRSDNTSSDVDMFRTGSTPKFDTTHDGWVYEFQDCGSTALIPDTGGDTLVIEGQDAALVTRFKQTHCIQLPNEDGGSNGTLMVLAPGGADVTRVRMEVDHCTAVPRPDSPDGLLKLFEGTLATSSLPAGAGTFCSNIVWRPVAGNGKITGSIKTPEGIDVTFSNSVLQATHNDYFRVTGDPYDGIAAGEYSARGTSDVAVDPAFVDATRDFGAWAALRDATLTTWDAAVAAMEATVLETPGFNSNLTVANALTWIRGGFVPQNEALKSVAHDGGDIGAMAVPGSTPPQFDTSSPRVVMLGGFWRRRSRL
jgi:hypothetical protein